MADITSDGILLLLLLKTRCLASEHKGSPFHHWHPVDCYIHLTGIYVILMHCQHCHCSFSITTSLTHELYIIFTSMNGELGKTWLKLGCIIITIMTYDDLAFVLRIKFLRKKIQKSLFLFRSLFKNPVCIKFILQII